MSSSTASSFEDWIGRQDSVTDTISPGPAARLSALLDHRQSLAVVGDALPPCWHWLYFLDPVPGSELGEDGHRKRGGFLPPVTLPRRMWAGSRIRFHSPMRIGDEVRRDSSIASIVPKRGSSGELVFVQIDHHFFRGEELLLEERQDIVYREGGRSEKRGKHEGAEKKLESESGTWYREVVPDQTLLFRYSALTFNSHRIHYDRDYAMGEEGYPELVVQGPLTATLLLDLLYRQMPEAELVSFVFRGERPLYEGRALGLHGTCQEGCVNLCAVNEEGVPGMLAEAKLKT